MDYLVDTIEARLQMRLGQQAFEIEALKQQLSDAYKRIADLEAQVAEAPSRREAKAVA